MKQPSQRTDFVSKAEITAIGSYVPPKVITNSDLEQMVQTDNEWILRRTGIEERHQAADDQFTSHLAIAAVQDLFGRFPSSQQDVDAIIVATSTPDMPFPSVAAQVQKAICAARCLAVDISAACAGFVTALQMANGLILSGAYRKVLVIGAETLTKITDYTDRSTCILFGDGAGAVLMETSEEGALLASNAVTEGTGGSHVYCTGLSKQLDTEILLGQGNLVQNGREVYKWALSTIPEGVTDLLQKSGHRLSDLDWFIPHSANLRMIEAICERLEFPSDKVLESVVRNGNTSAASIPLALDAAYKQGKLKPGNLMALYGFGAGLTQSGLLVKWTLS
ncbi:3-oxoacyl-ACP synthase [Cohnella kolymensis]|uniref:Beta-ketoacyl-[acyl-carrier-protein] synthase III n=1 Tax=Cohnella kolymensis TaxID=1590652 RepID=A0ABR5A138_9BACL|nr:ketoacyl-ACP synthase III [Cohnella kolymensis]KIL34685.1 3-oxoacyl-ACP synthase [Cohnella kolymensis]